MIKNKDDLKFLKKFLTHLEKLTLEKALNLDISRRLYFYLKKKIKEDKSLKLKKKTLGKIMNWWVERVT